MNEGIVGGVYWVAKGHMVPEATGGQASDSICHGVLTVSRCFAVQIHLGVQWYSGKNQQAIQKTFIQISVKYILKPVMSLFLMAQTKDILYVLKDLQLRVRNIKRA